MSKNSLGVEPSRGRTETSIDDERMTTRSAPTGDRRLGIYLLGQGDEAALVSVVSDPPGHRSETHHHDTDVFELIVEGSVTIGRKTYGAGSIRVQEAYAVYGPVVAGPEGYTMVVVAARPSGIVPRFARETDRLAREHYTEAAERLAQGDFSVLGLDQVVNNGGDAGGA